MMACVDFVESVGVSGGAPTAFGWLSPRISFSVDNDVDGTAERTADPATAEEDEADGSGSGDFEFCLSLPPDDQVLPAADELFYQGKLMPLHQHCKARPSPTRICDVISASKPVTVVASDVLTVSPKAPKCSSRWKELLGLKRTPKQTNENPLKSSSASANSKPPKSLKQLFRGFDNKASASSASGSTTSAVDLNQPLLQPARDSDADSASARISVSSDMDELPPRLSFENNFLRPLPPRVNVRRHVSSHSSSTSSSSSSSCRRGRSPYRSASNIEAKLPPRGSSVDSPRMNSSGKIIYQSLERSCSSPSTFNGGNRNRDYYYYSQNRRAMERSYSANVRVTPVLNVPVCSLRASSSKSSASTSSASASAKGTMFGITQLFAASQKKDAQSQSQSQWQSQSHSRCSKSNPHYTQNAASSASRRDA